MLLPQKCTNSCICHTFLQLAVVSTWYLPSCVDLVRVMARDAATFATHGRFQSAFATHSCNWPRHLVHLPPIWDTRPQHATRCCNICHTWQVSVGTFATIAHMAKVPHACAATSGQIPHLVPSFMCDTQSVYQMRRPHCAKIRPFNSFE